MHKRAAVQEWAERRKAWAREQLAAARHKTASASGGAEVPATVPFKEQNEHEIKPLPSATPAAQAPAPEPNGDVKEDIAMTAKTKSKPRPAKSARRREAEPAALEAPKTAEDEIHEKTGKTGENGSETADLPAPTGRDPATGQFVAGNAGGPGRPPRSRMTARLDELADARLEAIMKGMLDRAEEGDAAATRFVLDRRWPKIGAPAPAIAGRDGEPPADVQGFLSGLVDAAARGELTAADAAALTALAAQLTENFGLAQFDGDGEIEDEE